MKQNYINYGGGGGIGGTGGISDVTAMIDCDVFDSSLDQTEYNLSFSYIVGANKLFVSSGGLEMAVNVDYQEIDTNTINFFDPRGRSEIVIVRKIRTVVS